MTEPERRGGPQPWYARGKSIALGIGALAAAGVAVFALWDRVAPEDVVDVATIGPVEVLRQSALSDYAEARTGLDLALQPAPESAPLLGRSTVSLSVSTSGPGATPASTTQPSEPPATPTPTPTPAPASTDEPQPHTDAPTTPPASEPVSTAPPPTPFLPPRFSPTLPWTPGGTELVAVAADPVLDDWDISEYQIALITTTETVDPEEGEIDPGEVAVRLAAALERVESTEERNPLGWAVGVQLMLEGYEGVPLLLTWSLDGLDVPVTWSADNVAYRIVATTPRDSGSAELWVPNLSGEGTYNVNVNLWRASDGLPVASAAPLTLPVD